MTQNWIDITRRPEWIPCLLLMCLMYVSFGTGRGGATSLPLMRAPYPASPLVPPRVPDGARPQPPHWSRPDSGYVTWKMPV